MVSVTIECVVDADSGEEAIANVPESYDDEKWKTVDGHVKEVR